MVKIGSSGSSLKSSDSMSDSLSSTETTEVLVAQNVFADSKGVMGSEYAKQKRELMDLVNRISSTGASLDVEQVPFPPAMFLSDIFSDSLPSIVVAGNQSSGKSSLIEAISGINLPRDSGTCTRVPMEVRLRQDMVKDWSCQIYLRRETDESGTPLDNISEIAFGPVITDPTHVEKALRRAQLAILNPSVDPARFVEYDIPAVKLESPIGDVKPPLSSKKQLAFSKNLVIVSILGPNVTDLTLVDLPGIISSVSKNEDPANIELVTDLVKHYIKKDCLILLVITMKDDIQNQRAVMLANEFDPEGKRTIGVLTKVDTLQGRETNEWLPIVKNEKEALLRGYYVTRQPNADELAEKITFEHARAKESSFFADTEPWNRLPAKWKARLGTKNLTAFLSDQLMAFIKAKLPSLIDKINETYESVSTSLSELPAPPSADPSTEMLNLVNTFTQDLRAFVEGSRHHEKLIQDVNVAYRTFKKRIWATAPRFVPYNKAEVKADSDKGMAGQDFIGELEDIKERGMGIGGLGRKSKDLDDVQNHIARSMTRELPHNVPFASKVSLIEETIVDWKTLALEIFDTFKPFVEAVLGNLSVAQFGKYNEGMLPTTVGAVIRDQVQDLAQNTQAMITWLVRLDATPFTLNDHYFDDLRGKMLAHLKDKRHPKPVSITSYAPNNDTYLTTALANLANLGYTGLTEADLKKLRPVDKYETELEVMAETRAYFQVAYKRIIDNLPRLIDAEFIQPLPAAMQQALIKELAISSEGGRDRCKAFLAESPLTSMQREELSQRKNRLQQAKDAVRRFGMN